MSLKINKIDNIGNKSKANRDSRQGTVIDWSGLLNKDIQLFDNSLNLKSREAFYSELAILLSAGLDIQRALELIEQSQKKKKTKVLFKEIKEQIINGASLSAAVKDTRQFSDYEIFSLQIGEESGQLVKVLNQLADFFSRSIKYRRQLLGALAYPSFVIGFAFLVIFFLLKYLVPLFEDIYQRFDGELPTITERIIGLSNWVGAYAPYIFLVFIFIVLMLYQFRRRKWFRSISAFILLHVPIFGKIFTNIFLSRFCQSFHLLLSSKVPLLQAVRLTEKMIGFFPIQQSLKKASIDIVQGKTLHHSLSQSSFYPLRFMALVKVGEESSQLDTIFQKLADQYNEEVEQQTALIGSLLEPILIVAIGVLVGVILVAMYLPLFQLSVGVG